MTELAETVDWNGQTLYAPVMMCRPVNPMDYPPTYQRVWKTMAAEIGKEPIVYTGSVLDSCETCDIAVTVGPSQQVAVEAAHDVGLAVHVTCMVCVALHAVEADEEKVISLGNPEGSQGPFKAPVCPGCAQSPDLVLADGHQAFCGNEKCLVLTWNMFDDPAQYKAKSRIVDVP